MQMKHVACLFSPRSCCLVARFPPYLECRSSQTSTVLLAADSKASKTSTLLHRIRNNFKKKRKSHEISGFEQRIIPSSCGVEACLWGVWPSQWCLRGNIGGARVAVSFASFLILSRRINDWKSRPGLSSCWGVTIACLKPSDEKNQPRKGLRLEKLVTISPEFSPSTQFPLPIVRIFDLPFFPISLFLRFQKRTDVDLLGERDNISIRSQQTGSRGKRFNSFWTRHSNFEHQSERLSRQSREAPAAQVNIRTFKSTRIKKTKTIVCQ